eukprot:INCI3676.5.p1 GENE.INCI3676.5~~INCI3676.5.p1  ORF type:complete len:304 (+),score=85.72 INCI3676.5:120-1031(+)
MSSSSSGGGSAAAYAELRSKHNRLIEVLGVTVNYKDELTAKISDLSAALKEAVAERDRVLHEHSTSSESVVQKDARIRFLEDHANESLQTIQDLRKQLAQGSQINATRRQQLVSTAQSLRKDLAALRNDFNAASADYKNETDSAFKRMLAMVQRFQRQSKDNGNDAAAAATAAAAAALSSARVQQLESALEEKGEQVRGLEKTVSGHKKRIRQLEFTMNEQADGFGAKLSFSKMENSELLSQLAAARTSLKAAEATVADLREQLANVDTTTSSASAFKQFLEVKAQNQKLLEQVKRLKARVRK